MPIIKSKNLRFYKFDIFPGNVIHGVFTRYGGVSPDPWHSLNLGGTVGDSKANVIENRQRIFNVFNRDVNSIFDVWQVHGNKVICTNIPRPLDAPHQEADAILTNKTDVTLFMRFADCVPILLYDPVMSVIGLVHAGWIGTINKIAATAVRKMNEFYGCNYSNILAGIGPSICVDHYEVGNEVVEQVNNSFGVDSGKIINNKNSKPHFNLWEANRLTLEEAGVTSIQVSEICTSCHIKDWFSHRAEKGKTGRFGVLIALK